MPGRDIRNDMFELHHPKLHRTNLGHTMLRIMRDGVIARSLLRLDDRLRYTVIMARREKDQGLDIETGSVWQHYKGEKYIVMGFARDAESEGLLILYRPVGPKTRIPWARSYDEWAGEVAPGLRRFLKIGRTT